MVLFGLAKTTIKSIVFAETKRIELLLAEQEFGFVDETIFLIVSPDQCIFYLDLGVFSIA